MSNFASYCLIVWLGARPPALYSESLLANTYRSKTTYVSPIVFGWRLRHVDRSSLTIPSVSHCTIGTRSSEAELYSREIMEAEKKEARRAHSSVSGDSF
jgi:hypothetical protein